MQRIQVRRVGGYECWYDCELDGDPHRMNVCKKIRKSIRALMSAKNGRE